MKFASTFSRVTSLGVEATTLRDIGKWEFMRFYDEFLNL